MDRVKILAIVGSQRQDSLNLQLAQKAADILGKNVEYEILTYSDVPLLSQDIEFPAPASVTRIREKVLGADGIWFFTPEHNHFFPSALKNLVDWLSRPWGENKGNVLAGKPAAISGITPGTSGTAIAQDHLVTLLSFLNMDIMNQPRLTVANAFSQVKDGKLSLDASQSYLERQASAFVEFIEKRRKLS